jgi:hypothetical protein
MLNYQRVRLAMICCFSTSIYSSLKGTNKFDDLMVYLHGFPVEMDMWDGNPNFRYIVGDIM